MEKLLTKWFENPETNLGIVIHAYDNNGQQISVIHSDDVEQDSPLVCMNGLMWIVIKIDKL